MIVYIAQFLLWSELDEVVGVGDVKILKLVKELGGMTAPATPVVDKSPRVWECCIIS